MFLHPGLGGARSWGRFAPLLCGALGRAGIAYTRDEYEWRDGQCVLPGDFVDRQAERLEELLRAWGIERALMIGSSDGASIALAHAARHPARVQAIVSIAAHVMIDPQMPRALERIRKETSGVPPPWLIDAHGAQGPMLAQALVPDLAGADDGGLEHDGSAHRHQVPGAGAAGERRMRTACRCNSILSSATCRTAPPGC